MTPPVRITVTHLYGDGPGPLQCTLCLRWFRPGNLVCMLNHVADGCCHNEDTEVPPPEAA